jgi:hypothetical protein
MEFLERDELVRVRRLQRGIREREKHSAEEGYGFDFLGVRVRACEDGAEDASEVEGVEWACKAAGNDGSSVGKPVRRLGQVAVVLTLAIQFPAEEAQLRKHTLCELRRPGDLPTKLLV